MKYRFKPSDKKHAKREKKPYRRAGADSPRRLYGYRSDAIDLSMLFEIAKLEGRSKKSLRYRLLRFLRRLALSLEAFCTLVLRGARRAIHALDVAFLWLRERISRAIENRRARRKEPSDLPILAGALVAVTAVAFVSAFAVLYKLLLSDFFGRYQKITVPDMVGMSYGEARASLDEDLYNITVSYDFSTSVPAGSVISQSPSGGVERKVFSGGSLCTVSMVVSRGKEMREIADYRGMSARDASLELKNSAFSVITIEDHSPDVASGKVISTSPAAGEKLEVGGLVVLHVSRGKEIVTLTVPSLKGLTEGAATRKIAAAGFVLGNVEYRSSEEVTGVVISQDREASAKAPKGSKISIIVSAGQEFSSKTLPSLYGLTVEAAREKLAEYGLVLGNVYAAESNEPKGTVIAQSPSAGSDISPSLVSVDMYVSS